MGHFSLEKSTDCLSHSHSPALSVSLSVSRMQKLARRNSPNSMLMLIRVCQGSTSSPPKQLFIQMVVPSFAQSVIRHTLSLSFSLLVKEALSFVCVFIVMLPDYCSKPT